MDMPATSDATREEAPLGANAIAPVALSRKRRTFDTIAPLSLCVAGAIALTLHKLLPNQQHADPTRLYPRLLLVIIVAGLVLSILRVVQPKSGLFARAISWCLRTAPIVAAGVLLLCAWDLITLKLNWMPLPYFPG